MITERIIRATPGEVRRWAAQTREGSDGSPWDPCLGAVAADLERIAADLERTGRAERLGRQVYLQPEPTP